MNRALIAALLLLSGCQKQTWTHDEIEDIADDVAADRAAELKSRVDDLESRLTQLEQGRAADARYLQAVDSDLKATQSQVSQNAKVANKNALADATARGDCGREGFWESAGIYRVRNTPCTEENYFKQKK